ncbi:DNA cytosine methyltransferase [Streptomyces sp. H27-H5]|uniref:DNA cytosine methyltransferase n=1 Tax=Streptomyces sp. H27-H5 TaxID=2996460 RepID=UPI00226EE915|nr:DNA cytosine methyltransferase [Streptomyces sp. H27-H5]MCY0959632.1 DNA cytosine methyltransferase [Streptomyces sp. H27-H5]
MPGQLALDVADGLRIGSLCSGYGGLDMAVMDLLGATVAWHCQYDPDDKHQYAARILAHHWPHVPNHGDVTAVDWSAVEPVDILTAGFPCQDVSLAGKRAGVIGDTVVPAGALLCGNCRWGDHDHATCEAASPSGAVPSRLSGMAAAAAVAELNTRDLADPAGPPPERVIKGTRSGLWFHVARAIAILRPRLVVIENVRGLLSAKAVRGVGPDGTPVDEDGGDADTLRAVGAVLGDLADLGFDAEWHVQRASEIGAPHQRERVFIIAWPAADTDHERVERAGGPGREPQRHVARPHRAAADAQGEGQQGRGVRGRPTGGRPAAQDPDRSTRGERGVAAPGQEEAGRARPDSRRRGRAPVADAEGERHGDARPTGERGIPAAAVRSGVADVPDPASAGRGEGSSIPDGIDGTPSAGGEGEPSRDGAQRVSGDRIEWGQYAPAVERWEAVTGRPAPRPTDDRGRLTAEFVEWMMGLAHGHVTAVPGLSRPAQLKALGNGVVPQQAAHAIRFLLYRADIAERFGLAA